MVGMFSIKICSSQELLAHFSVDVQYHEYGKIHSQEDFRQEELRKGTWYADSWSETDNKLQDCLHTKFLLSFNNLAQVSHGYTLQFQLSYKSVW